MEKYQAYILSKVSGYFWGTNKLQFFYYLHHPMSNYGKITEENKKYGLKI